MTTIQQSTTKQLLVYREAKELSKKEKGKALAKAVVGGVTITGAAALSILALRRGIKKVKIQKAQADKAVSTAKTIVKKAKEVSKKTGNKAPVKAAEQNLEARKKQAQELEQAMKAMKDNISTIGKKEYRGGSNEKIADDIVSAIFKQLKKK